MCDTVCALGPAGTLFAKNSDRPVAERQLLGLHPARPAGGILRTQYLELADTGAAATLLARPDWLWGAEHGVNEFGVAIGNERVETIDQAATAPAALIGMDLVRLGLERARTAEQAVEVIGDLLARHGKGGIGDRIFGEAYWSSFLVADRHSAWVLETSGRTWVAEPVADRMAIGNRLTVRTGWTRSSTDVPGGADFDRWRDPAVGTGYADTRLAASRTMLGQPAAVTPGRLAGHLRDHGTGPWGRPAHPRRRPAVGLPGGPDAAGGVPDFTVCLHVRQLMATTSGMVAELPAATDRAIRTWVAPGSPCVSPFVPVFPFAPSRAGGPGTFPSSLVPSCLADPAAAEQLDRLREQVEGPGGLAALLAIREVLDPLEDRLWAEADDLAGRPDRWAAAAADWDGRIRAALDHCLAGGDPPAG